MTITELKLELIRKIIATNDFSILNEIKEILQNKEETILAVKESSITYTKDEKVYVFNEWQEERINRALKQYEDGECISDEEAQKEIQAWLED